MRLIAALLAAAVFAAPSASAQTPPSPPAPPPSPSVAPAPGPLLTADRYSRYERASQVQLRDIAAYVRVRPENRPDVSVAVLNEGQLRAPSFRLSGDKLIIDGGMRRQIRSCDVEGAEGFSVRTARNGTLQNDDLPVIELRMPQNVILVANGAVRLRVGPAAATQIRVDGCGDADIERVAGDATASVSGTVDLRLYEADTVSAAVAGAGDLTLGVAHNGLTISIAGSGDVVAARADGPTNIAIQGAGDVLIREGRATTMSVAIAGAGDVTHNGSAEQLDVAIFGGGDVRVRQVDGPVTRRVIGGGEVVIGR